MNIGYFKLILLTVLMLFYSGVKAANETGPTIKGTKYDVWNTTVKTTSVTAVKADNGRWGFVNQFGKQVIKPKYQAIGEPQSFQVANIHVSHNLTQEVIPVMLNGKWGFVNSMGKEFVKPVYDFVGEFTTTKKTSGLYEGDPEGTCQVMEGNTVFTINNKGKRISKETYQNIVTVDGLSFSNTNNQPKVIFSNGKWTDIQRGNNGFFLSNSKTNKKAFYNQTENKIYPIVLSPNWVKNDDGLIYKLNSDGKIDKNATGFNDIQYFNDVIITRKNNNKGLYSSSGQEILPPEYEEIITGSKNCVIIKKDGKYGLAATNGIIFVKPTYQNLSFKNGYVIATTNDNKKGILDSTGAELIAPSYDDLLIWSDNLFITQQNNKYGAITSNGTILLEPKYKDISQNGNFLTLDDGRSNSIYNINSRKIVLSNFEEIGDALYSNSKTTFYPIKRNGKWGIINDDYQIVIPCNYKGVWSRSRERDYAYIENAAGVGLVEMDGNTAKIVVTPGIFSSFYKTYETNYIIGEKNNSLGAYCKKNGAIIKPGQGAEYTTQGGGIIFGPKKNKWGRVNAFNSKGQFLGGGNFTNEYQLNNWLRQIWNKLK